jgi:RND family efflux transporter MFP subunit
MPGQSASPVPPARPHHRGRCRNAPAWRLLLLVAGWTLASGGAALAQGAPPAPPPVTVAQPLQRNIVEWDEYTGQFQAVDAVAIRARVSGYLTEINFKDGEIVKKGELLFVIDPRPFEIARDAAKAQLAQAQAQLELANRELARAAELRQHDFVAASTYDQRLQTLRAAQAAVDTANTAIRSAELNLEFTHITAPFTGRVGQHQISVGNLVTGGEGGATTLLATIVSLDPIHFIFDMSEADFLSYQRSVAEGRLPSTREGSLLVAVRLTDETNWKRQGILDFVDNEVNRSAGTIRARGIFPNPDFFITPGQFGRIRVPGSDNYEAILIPDEAIATDQSRKIVMTVKDDGTVEPRVIRPGPRVDGLRVVRQGLSAKDRIIIDGLVRARPGAKVTPQAGTITAVPDAS